MQKQTDAWQKHARSSRNKQSFAVRSQLYRASLRTHAEAERKRAEKDKEGGVWEKYEKKGLGSGVWGESEKKAETGDSEESGWE